MAKEVGMSRAVKKEWLDKVVELVITKTNEKEIANELVEYLSYEIKDTTNLNKTKAILLNTWAVENVKNKNIRELALSAIQNSDCDKLALNWCMLILAYPIFSDVCQVIGKITTIQDNFTVNWLKEKLFEKWGETTTLLYAVEKVLQTLKQIGAIESSGRGKYIIKKYNIKHEVTVRIIVMTILQLNEKAYYELNELMDIPQFFPFRYSVTHEMLYNTDCFNMGNFGGKIVLTH